MSEGELLLSVGEASAAPVVDGSAGAGGVSTRELADALGVSPQTIANWVAVGMPVLDVIGGGEQRSGSRRFDVERCREWAAENRPALMGVGHGGTRAGAGRRPGRPPGSGRGDSAWGGGKPGRPLGSVTRAKVSEADGMLPLDAAREHAAKEDERGDDDDDRSPARLKVLADVREKGLKAQKLEMELAEKRGLLIERAEVESAWAAGMAVIRARVESLAGRLMPDLMAVLGSIEPAQRIRVDAALRAAIEGVIEEIGGARGEAA